MEVSYKWIKGNVTPVFKNARGRAQGSILFNDLSLTKSTFSASAQMIPRRRISRIVDMLNHRAAIQSYFDKLETETKSSLTNANEKSSIWDWKSPCKGRGQHGLVRKQLTEKNLEVQVGRGLDMSQQIGGQQRTAAHQVGTSKTGQEVFPFIWHPWGHTLP